MSALQPYRRITGTPGDVWTNETGRVYFQLKVQFRNSCGQCIQYANQIAPYWPLPFHNNCNCEQTPIRPGESADAFVDFRAELDQLPLSQKVAAVGASNWKLIKDGVVTWEDVVQPGRIRTLREVVARKKLSNDVLKNAGINKSVRSRVLGVVESPEVIANQVQRAGIVSALRNNGVSDQRIREALRGNLTTRLNLLGPSNPSPITTTIPTVPTIPTPSIPPAPAAAPLAIPRIEPQAETPLIPTPTPITQFIEKIQKRGKRLLRKGKRRPGTTPPRPEAP